MSQQYTLEIENFNGKQSLITDVQSVAFSDYAHLPAATVGMTTKMAEQAKEIIIYRSFDNYSHLFAVQTGKSFPKAVLRVKNSGGKSYLLTFLKTYLDSYYPYNSNGSIEVTEKIQFSFDEFSVKEDSSVGNTAKPKSSDKKAAATMNMLKN